jgi:hypothetical protein
MSEMRGMHSAATNWTPVYAAVVRVLPDDPSIGEHRQRVDLIDVQTRYPYREALILGAPGVSHKDPLAPLTPVTKNLKTHVEFSENYSDKFAELEADPNPEGWNGDFVVGIPVGDRIVILGTIGHIWSDYDIEPSVYEDLEEIEYTTPGEPIEPTLDTYGASGLPTVQRNQHPDCRVERFGAVVENWFETRGIVTDVRDSTGAVADYKYTSKVLTKQELRDDRASLRAPYYEILIGDPTDDQPIIEGDWKSRIRMSEDVKIEMIGDGFFEHDDAFGLKVHEPHDEGKEFSAEYHSVVKWPQWELLERTWRFFIDELQREYNQLLADFNGFVIAVQQMIVVGQATLKNAEVLAYQPLAQSVGNIALPQDDEFELARGRTVSVGDA